MNLIFGALVLVCGSALFVGIVAYGVALAFQANTLFGIFVASLFGVVIGCAALNDNSRRTNYGEL